MLKYSLDFIKNLTAETLKPYESKSNVDKLVSIYKQAKSYATNRYNRVQKAISNKQRYYDPLDLYETTHGRQRVDKSFIPDTNQPSAITHEIVRYRDYLRAETSTLEGARREAYRIINMVESKTGYRIPYSNYQDFMDTYKAIRKEIASSVTGGKYELWRKMGETFEEIGYDFKSYDEFIDWFKAKNGLDPNRINSDFEVSEDDEFEFLETEDTDIFRR